MATWDEDIADAAEAWLDLFRVVARWVGRMICGTR